MSAPTTRLVWSRPATFMGIAKRSSAALVEGGEQVLHVDRQSFKSGVYWHARVDAWHIDIRIPGLDGTTSWPQARAAALLHLDALLASRLSLIARARR